MSERENVVDPRDNASIERYTGNLTSKRMRMIVIDRIKGMILKIDANAMLIETII